MNNSTSRFSDEITPDLLALAARYHADSLQGYSESELVAAAAEVDIPAEFIQQAIREIAAQKSHKLKQRQRIQQQRQRATKLGVGCLSIIALWSVWTYNSFSGSAVQVATRWAQVENQLQRRANLIPNLVNVTQSYAQQEKSLTNTLVQAQTSHRQAATVKEKTAAIMEIDRAIEQFNDYAAGNPRLKTSQLFINLQYEITGTENRLAVERMRYHQAVQDYNQTIQTFPNIFLAKIFNFHQQPLS